MSIVWSNAFTVTGLGLLIVFTVLVLLVFLLGGFSRFFIQKEKPLPAEEEPEAAEPEVEESEILQFEPIVTEMQAPLTAAEEAAVAMALHLFYEDIHDEESYVITINKGNAPYNPWSSKIYGLNNTI